MDLLHDRMEQTRTVDDRGRRARVRLLAAAAASTVVVLLVLVTSESTRSQLGAPAYWPWVLTGLQVTALWAAGSRRWWGWPLGAAVQPPWIAYALVTDQIGFVPGCAVSCAIQALSFLRAARSERIRSTEEEW